MPRRPRVCTGGTCFHVLNRAVVQKGKGARLPLLEKLEDYEAFERVLIETHAQFPLPLLCYCLMPNHWHFVVRPANNNPLSDFFRWLTHTHVMRWHAHCHTEGTGHLYQGRFKAFAIDEDDPLDAVLHYAERNPVRAELCERVEDWKFGSAWRMERGDAQSRSILSDCPIPRPMRWRDDVNQVQSKSEVDAIRASVKRGIPSGSDSWITQSAVRLHLAAYATLKGATQKKSSRPSQGTHLSCVPVFVVTS